jgi:PHD-finger
MVEDSLQTRRRKRGHAGEQEKLAKIETIEMADGDEIAEDDEAVRCICGNDEYPGPPQLQEEDSKKGIKDSSEVEFITEADYTEDLAGFFLQCDMCKVWQHGGCVGIKNEDMSPEEYFCELCRKDLHRIFTALNG